MNTWLVIPVKSLHDGKSRLASALDPVQRRTFMDRLLVHTLKQAAAFPGLDRTLMVSACGETRARAAALGAQVLNESGCGLNAAVKRAHANIRQRGATQMLVIPCDLPFLCTEDLQYLSRLAMSKVIVVAPDRSLLGTNGLCFDAALDFGFEFGPDSYARHTNNAQRLQLDHAAAKRPGLAFDVDTPDDLAELYKREGYQPLVETVSAP
jgi:2-phospho-L-lactate guanylyltransferase